MIVLLRRDATPEDVESLAREIRALGLDVVPLDDGKGRAFEVIGSERGRVLALRGATGVEEILTRRAALTGGEPVWPHFVLRVSILALVLLAVLGLLTAFLPPGLGERAASGQEAGGGATEWYLLPLRGFFDLFPASLHLVGGILVACCWLVLLLWPFLDRGSASTTPVVRALGVLTVVVVLALALGALR